jgi:hypothetical protein
MKTILFLISLISAFNVFAQNELDATSAKHHANLRADDIHILLVKDIEHISDSTKTTHHHDPHKSSFKIIHMKFMMVSNDPKIKGMKTVVMRMLDPQGHEIYDEHSGGGSFYVGKNEEHYTYSYKGDFNGEQMPVDFLYKHPKQFKKGIHIIELYVDGLKIGEEHFLIK